MSTATIRLGTERDAPTCLRIYAPIVEQTAISFEIEVPSVEEMERRIADTLIQFPWLVLEEPEGVQGYAYAGLHRKRPAYQWSVEVSVYVAAAARGRGVGRRLYTVLFDLLRRQGYVSAFAGIVLPNDASVGLHEAMGFRPIGVYRNIGFKLDRWLDVGWWHLQLQEPPSRPAAPLPIADLKQDPEWASLWTPKLRGEPETIAGYRVTVTYVNTDPADQERRRAALARIIVRSQRKLAP